MGEEVISKNFIEQEIDKDLAEGVYDHGMYQFPAGTQRLSAYRTCKVHTFKFMDWRRNTMGHFNLRFDDTNPTKENIGICRVDQRRM